MRENMVQEKVVVVIPVHSPNPSAYELISFKQCFAVLGNHPIKVLAPMGLELAAYRAVVSAFDTVFIAPKWQRSVRDYNKLKTSRFFYRLFKNYQFLLTYELDAFVFRDDLLFWCDKGYDYIGAPWFEGFSEIGNNNTITGVGNSGFSLRKISSIEEILKQIFYKNEMEYTGKIITRVKGYVKMSYRWPLNMLSNQLGENYTMQKNFPYHEDIFFGIIAPQYAKNFKVASVADAVRFSFELRPKLLYELNGEALPMGCHAWWRYALDFWRPHIEKLGYSL